MDAGLDGQKSAGGLGKAQTRKPSPFQLWDPSMISHFISWGKMAEKGGSMRAGLWCTAPPPPRTWYAGQGGGEVRGGGRGVSVPLAAYTSAHNINVQITWQAKLFGN